MRKAMATAAVAAIALAGWAGCSFSGSSVPGDRLAVAVGIPPQAWLVEQIGGDRVEVVCLLASGDDPHSFQPADVLISRVLGCRLYFLSGLAFERAPWFQALRAARGLELVDTRAGIALRQMAAESAPGTEAQLPAAPETAPLHGVTERGQLRRAHEHRAAGQPHSHGGEDPHVWLAPGPLKIMAQNVASALIAADPAHRTYYEEHLRQLDERLDRLDADLRAKLAPLRGRPFLVYHPSWGYLADAYGLRQVAAELEGKPPSDYQLTRLARLVRQEKIRVLFSQPQVPATDAETVARALGTRVRVIDPLAADVVENLRQTADALLESYGDP